MPKRGGVRLLPKQSPALFRVSLTQILHPREKEWSQETLVPFPDVLNVSIIISISFPGCMESSGDVL